MTRFDSRARLPIVPAFALKSDAHLPCETRLSSGRTDIVVSFIETSTFQRLL